LGKGEQKAFIFDGFNPKDDNSYEYISNQKNLKNFSDFFDEVDSIGIKKSRDGKAQDDAFFRKKSYMPKKGASFAFVATFSQPIKWNSALVSLGADQSSFMLHLEETDKDFENIFDSVHQIKKYSRLVLASETPISKEAYMACDFIFGKRGVYRQLTDSRKGKKSKRYYLLERGTVLYSDKIDELEKLIKQEHLQNVGINHYFKIQGEKNV